LWNLVETAYTRRVTFAPDDNDTTKVHRAMLTQFRREVEASGAKLLVANLWTMVPYRGEWKAFFEENHFAVANCVADGLPYKHPDAFWDLRHADCIERDIRARGWLHD
jgi:hypothetical protein